MNANILTVLIGLRICVAPCTNRVHRYVSPSLLMCICKRYGSSSISAICVRTPFICFSSATCG